VLLNDNFNIVLVRRSEAVGEVVTVKDVLDDGVRVVVSVRGDENKVVELSDSLRGTLLRPGDIYRLDQRSLLLLERLAQPEVEDLLLEDVPNISYENIGGLDTQIELIADAVELPFLHQALLRQTPVGSFLIRQVITLFKPQRIGSKQRAPTRAPTPRRLSSPRR
jgi:proteasome-associated ATPase